MLMYIIGLMVTGFVVGLIARALKPGDDSMSLGKTTAIGIVGALLAGWVGRMSGWYASGAAAGFVASTAGAIVVLFVYYEISHRKSKMIRH